MISFNDIRSLLPFFRYDKILQTVILENPFNLQYISVDSEKAQKLNEEISNFIGQPMTVDKLAELNEKFHQIYSEAFDQNHLLIGLNDSTIFRLVDIYRNKQTIIKEVDLENKLQEPFKEEETTI